ncbi:hypothetical protein B0O80DRAFT_447722 [Mortierella sp. GBAus27b]|nr:hypothetical protein B0O80DRAFT_447722 [Mortierella sp. GBAus27b]
MLRRALLFRLPSCVKSSCSILTRASTSTLIPACLIDLTGGQHRQKGPAMSPFAVCAPLALQCASTCDRGGKGERVLR